ncbi:hypothetical protein KR067_004248 [Drosophila pandora]|nr:hypothetical protein KR067_004248 [Drosophila pandora]
MDFMIAHQNIKMGINLLRRLCKILPDLKCKSLAGFGRQLKDQMSFIIPSSGFFKDSMRFMKRCTKPNRQEFRRTCMAIAVGFFIMGTIGFLVKLMHIPITNIIMG